MRNVPPAGTWIICILFGAIALGATPEQNFNELYGAKAKAANTPAQRVALASQMLSDAAALKDDQAFQSYLYLKIVDLAGNEPTGYGLARQALEELEKSQPQMRQVIEDRFLTLLDHQYRAGPMSERKQAAELYLERINALADQHAAQKDIDGALAALQKASMAAQLAGRDRAADLATRIKTLHTRQGTERTVATLQAKFAQDSTDTKTADELVRLMAVELDQPADAAPYAARSSDPAARLAVLAAGSATTMPVEQLPAVANWYRIQAGKASDSGRMLALTRARGYYTTFLEQHAKEDTARLEAKLALADVNKLLVKDQKQRTVNLLPLVDADKDTVKGSWKLQQGKLRSLHPDVSTLALPYAPPDEYNLRVKYEKAKDTSLTVLFSLHGKLAGASVGVPGMLTGIDAIRGKRVGQKDNPTSMRYPASETPGVHQIEVRVRTDSIQVYIDGVLTTRYYTDGSDLSTPEGYDLGGYGIGLGLGVATIPTNFLEIELTEVLGKGHPLKHKH